MIRVGKGKEERLALSMEVAADALKAPKFILFFSKLGTLGEAARFLAERFPDIPTMGFCSTTVLNNGISEEPDILLVSFEEEYRIACGLIRDLSECPVQNIYQLRKDLESIEPGEEDTVCIEYCTNNEEMLVTTLTAMLDKYGVPLIGSTVVESMGNNGRGEVAFRGEIYENACIYALIRCERGKVRTYYENIYMRTELSLHQVTKADVKNRCVVELDGRPAADVYCDVVQTSRKEIHMMGQRYPLGRVLGSQVFVTAIEKVLPDGTLKCYKRINPNDAICFMDYGRYREVTEETLERIQSENKGIYFTLVSECIVRYLLYRSERFWEKHAERLGTLGDNVVALSAGEQYHHQHINQAMVLVVFSHEPEEGESGER